MGEKHSRQGTIPMRGVRVEDDIWKPAMEKATANGEHLSDVIRRALRRYARS